MTPASIIAALDRQIAHGGGAVVLCRGEQKATVLAIVRDYETDELTDGMEQGDSRVIVSPSSLRGTAFEATGIVGGDEIMIAGRLRRIQPNEPRRFAGVPVRYNLIVTG